MATFIWNADKTVLINVDWILKLSIDNNFDGDTWVSATLRYGSEILFHGNRNSCMEFLKEFQAKHS